MDPATGDGLASNPFFDESDPRTARSRTYALGLRNPFRFSIRPGTGNSNPASGDPGVIYAGDVGWNLFEELHVIGEAGMRPSSVIVNAVSFASGTATRLEMGPPLL